MIDVDGLLEELGPMTSREKIQLALLLMPAMISALHMAGMMFLGFNQGQFCSMPEEVVEKCNITWSDELTERYVPWNAEEDGLDNCLRYKFDSLNCTFWNSNISFAAPNETEQCDSWNYDTSVFTSTVVGDFDLVCDNKYKRRLSQAIFMLGVVIATPVWGQVSDRYGRRNTVMLPLAIGSIVGIATSYANSFLAFTIMRIFVGVCLFPSFSCAFVLATESVKKRHKVLVGQTFQATFGVGVCMLPGLAYFVREWRMFQLCISLPGVAISILLWFTLESPRWLISSGNYRKANKIVKTHMTNPGCESREASKLQALSELQKKNADIRDMKEDTIAIVEEKIEIVVPEVSKETALEIFKLPNMRRKTFILCYEWMVTAMVYYGLTLNAAELGGNPILDAFLSAVTEVPSCYIAIPMLQKWGRRPTLISTLFLAGAACTCMMFVSKELMWLNVMLSIIGKFSISATFGTVYIYAVEIYPTPVRNVGSGICNSFARIGAMLSSFIAMLDSVGSAVPYVTLGLLALVGGFLGLLLPETAGKKIPETLEEAEGFGKHHDGITAVICGRKGSNSADNVIYNEHDGTKA